MRWPIAAGPNRGLRWSIASSGRGYLGGRFEPERIASLLALVRPGDHVWDIGAHKGYIALALSREVGDRGRVTAVEPSRVNQWFLRAHLRWNDIRNVDPLRLAVSDRSGEDRFGGTGSTLAFRLGRGDEIVRVATLDELIESDGLPPPDVIKIDTEGAELGVLEGGAGRALHPGAILMIAIHGRELCQAVRERLGRLGFDVHPSREMQRRLDDPALPWGADHDLVAFGSDRPVPDDLLARLPILAAAAPAPNPPAGER